VLGAGASLANALHFRSERLRHTRPPLDTTFFETVDAMGVTLSPWLRRYFESVVGIDTASTTLRELRMEEVFKDAFYDFHETPDAPVPFNAYIDLVDLYLRVLRETTNWLCADNRTGGPVGRLIDAAALCSDRLTLITFNHDLVIENELQRRARLKRRWCLDQGYGSMGGSLVLTYPQASFPLFGLHEAGDCDHSRPITVLKLHGSLNWVVRLQGRRPTAGFLSGQSGQRNIHLLSKREILGRETIIRTGRGRSRWRTWPIVVPPVYAKQGLRSAIEATWIDARAELQEADRVAFFGYSLPDIDVEAEKLFERALFRNSRLGWIDVINPAAASAARFAGVSGSTPVRWYPSLARFQEAGAFR
jgi:hypothetical protein